MHGSARWCLVLPVKRLDVAKTRLGAPYDVDRRALALAFALDTASAALSCPMVEAVLAVTEDPAAAAALRQIGVEVTGDAPDGLNPALEHGVVLVATSHPGTAVGTLAADLPALRPPELARVLAQASSYDRCFVRDAAGSGTTLLLAASPDGLRPAFGAASAARHAAGGAHEVTVDAPSLRRDVDTAADLDAALALGVGRFTRQVLDEVVVRPTQAG